MFDPSPPEGGEGRGEGVAARRKPVSCRAEVSGAPVAAVKGKDALSPIGLPGLGEEDEGRSVGRLKAEGQVEQVEYAFELPVQLAGKVKLVADLNYWGFSQAFPDHLLGPDAPKARIVKMASTAATVQVSRPDRRRLASSTRPERAQ